MASTKSSNDTEENNKHAPPSSCEEAAALLGAAISFDTSSSNVVLKHQEGQSNPPQGMHSIFTVQEPIPNQVLFIRLCNLRAWLRWHASGLNDPPSGLDIDDNTNHQLGISFSQKKKTNEPFNAARSILAVLMKLLEASSAVATGGGDNMNSTDILDPTAMSKVVKSLSPHLQQKQRKHIPNNKNNKQHKQLPPLLSTPLRNIWVECISLCLALGCSLPGNLRTDVNSILGKLMEITNWNPKSKHAAGGVRLATLQVLGQVCILNTDLAKRAAPYSWEILQCCHKGLLSGGAGEPGYRAACVKTACRLLVACRRAANSAPSISNNVSGELFTAPGVLEERVALEVMKFMKRATQDKYPEVRISAAVIAGLAAPMLIRIVPVSRSQRGGGSGRDGDANPLSWLEDVTQLAMRNIDDESAGVATAWSAALARCLCASAEHGASLRSAQSEEQASNRSVDVDDEAGPSSVDGIGVAAKFKAFSDSRRVVAATTSCSSVPATITYLTSQFVKTGGESTSARCGGSHSIGGRASRIGYADALTEFLRLQAAKGDYSLVEALGPVLEMVGASFEKQIRKKEGSSLINQMDFYAPSSPRGDSPQKKPPSSTMFLQRNTKANSTADSSIGRMLASNVVRCGISENLSELSQLMMLRALISACRSSVDPTSADGGTGSLRPANDSEMEGKQLNRHQLQVALIEISHLVVGLGEAGASSLEDLMPVLRDCLSYPDHGVRHEAAAVYAATAQAFPSEGRVFVIESLGTFSCNLDAIQSLASRVASTSSASAPRLRRFGRSNNESNDAQADELMKHQSTLHGNALAVSLLMHEFPHVIGGVATVIVSKVFDIIGKLLQCQFDDSFVKSNPTAACTVIRAGYCMLSGALSMGLDAVVPQHVSTVFEFWQNSSMHLQPGVSKFSSSHDLLWLETMLSSIVSFLMFSPELLLAVPDALTRLTALLEKVFPLISKGGRFQRESNGPVENARLCSARSSVLEAYSWLPPGSFPLSADRIFSFAAAQIQELSGNDVLCSILDSLVSSEDKLIEAHSVERAVGPGQVGGSTTLDNNISIRSSDIVHHNERESVMHLLAWRKMFRMSSRDNILSLYLREGDENSIPTPLHEVGTWQTPPDPTGTSKVRLLDTSIHVFAATFGLQDGHTQSEALRMLETVYLARQDEKANRFNTSLISESQGKVKPQEEDVTACNVIASVLACLQALPLHESTHDTLVDRGPPWMERATTLLLRLLPSPSGIIRRGAAEGLSLLATLGVSEDAHTLQSTILHSLDEVMQGTSASGGAGAKTQHPESITYAKAGSLLTLACIQRAAERMKKIEKERAISRSVARDTDHSENDRTPVMIMMTRLLPSLATQNMDADSLLTRTYALHSFGVLITNSIPKGTKLSPDQVQIIWKAVESVETSFLSAWSAVVSDNSKGRERDKFLALPALLSVLLRLMTTLLPWLIELKDLDCWLASRFAAYASTILEFSSNHPIILFEGSVFFESLIEHQEHLVSASTSCVVTTGNTTTIALPFLLSVIQPPYAEVVTDNELDYFSCHGPIDATRAAVLCLKRMCNASKSRDNEFTLDVGKALFAFLHDRCGRRRFQHFNNFRSLALSRCVVNYFEDCQMIEAEVIDLIQAVLKVQITGKDEKEKLFILLQWLLFSRCLASGESKASQDGDDSDLSIPALIEKARCIARANAVSVLQYSTPPRWQIKCVSANISSIAMMMLLDIDKVNTDGNSIFNLKAAQSRCTEMLRKEDNLSYGVDLHSQPIFHLEELIKTACSTATATSNHSELPSVQISGLRFLISLFHAFGSQADPSNKDGTSVLDQYSSQFISSVKHALKSESLVDESAPGIHRLYSAGCDALFVMISEDLISDPMVIRRLFQTVTLSAKDIPFVQYPTSDEGNERDSLLIKSSHLTDDGRSYPLFKLSKLIFLAKASMLIALKQIKESASSMISSELEKEEMGRAIHCAAAAIDGFFLSQQSSSSTSSGLTYKNIANLDDSVIQALIETWPTLTASATASIVKTLKATSEESEEKEHLKEWLTRLAPLIVSGVRQSLTSKSTTELLPVSEIAALLYAFRLFVKESQLIDNEVLCPAEIGDIATIVTESVVFKSIGISDSDGEDESPLVAVSDTVLIQQSCGLIEDLCQHYCSIGVDLKILTKAVVTPLAALQENRLSQPNNNGVIISACIRSSQSLLENRQEEEGRAEYEKALVQLVMTILSSEQQGDDTKAACLSLLKACCDKTMMSQEEWGQISSFTASHGLWEAWAIVCSSLPPGYGIKYSIDAIRTSLGDIKSGHRHTASLVSLRTALHTASVEDPSLQCFVLQSVGFEILQLLKAHGTRVLSGQGFDENRVTVVAESVKVNIMAYQYLNSVSAEEGNLISFISTLFEVLVENIRYNGLPNHPSGKVGGDETIGRMCAQVFVHVARTTPLIFKSTMGTISPESRTVLEAAVRADMSGYAAPQRESKKKISLKGFVR